MKKIIFLSIFAALTACNNDLSEQGFEGEIVHPSITNPNQY